MKKIDALRKSKDSYLSHDIVQALGDLGASAREVLPELKEMADSAQSLDLRRHAATAMELITGRKKK